MDMGVGGKKPAVSYPPPDPIHPAPLVLSCPVLSCPVLLCHVMSSHHVVPGVSCLVPVLAFIVSRDRSRDGCRNCGRDHCR